MIPFRAWRDALRLRDPIEQQQMSLLQGLLLGLISLSVLGCALALLLPGVPAADRRNIVIATLPGAIGALAALAILRRGHFQRGVALTALAMLGTFLGQLIPGGMRSPWFIFFLLALPISFAATLGGRRLLWTIVGLSMLGIGAIAIVEQLAPAWVGYRPPPDNLPLLVPIAVFSAVALILGLGVQTFGGTLRGALQEARRRALELDTLRAAQEQTIAAHTADLQAALATLAQREASLHDSLNALRDSNAVIAELSAPVIPILPGVLVAPLIGTLDSARAETLMQQVLHTIERERAHHLILDITGVPLVDTHVGQTLLRTADACALLGARVLLVGVRPEVAQTMVALNITLRAITTFASLREAVGALLRADGWRRLDAVPAQPPSDPAHDIHT